MENWDESSNQLICYNTLENTWKRLNQKGDVPSARWGSRNIISGDTLFLFGGLDRRPELYNDLYILDMKSFMWTKVHDNLSSEKVPRDSRHTLTKVSQSKALLLGKVSMYSSDSDSDCWLLDLDLALQLQDPSSIWTKISMHFVRDYHAAIVEPASQKLWVIGGYSPLTACGTRVTSDDLEMSINLVSLKDLALYQIASRINKDDDRLQPDRFPIGLRRQIEVCRANMHICNVEKGCAKCRYVKDQSEINMNRKELG